MYLKPRRVVLIINRFMPFASLLSLLLFVWGGYLALYASPPDSLQGEFVRIMYVHVPSSWGALFGYTVMATSALLGFISGSSLWYWVARSVAPVGACLTAISLITGSIWGKPTWGAWWVWDARLTTMLLLFFLYVVYGVMVTQIPRRETALKAAGLVAVIGWVNVPIIKWSVNWWYTLHQPASIQAFKSPTIDSQMLTPLWVMAAALFLWGVSVSMVRLLMFLRQQRSQTRHIVADVIFPSKEAA